MIHTNTIYSLKKFNTMETKNNTTTAIATRAEARCAVESALQELEVKTAGLYDDVLEMKTIARYTQRELTNFADWTDESVNGVIKAIADYRKAMKNYNNIMEKEEE